MIQISFAAMMVIVTCLWILIRGLFFWKCKKVNWKRELQLILVYTCIVVITRITFFPMETIDGKIQPLILDIIGITPRRINLTPFIYLFDYPERREALLNLIGNITMFIPVGIIWPLVYKKLNTHKKVIAAGIGFSFCIEFIQLLFAVRVSDIDDLMLNSLGFVSGYLLYLLFVKVRIGATKK